MKNCVNAFILWIGSVVFVLIATPLLAGFGGTEVYLPSVGNGPGVNSSFWHSTVWVHNRSNAPARVYFFLLERHANYMPLQYTDTIQPGETAKYDNAIQNMFNTQTFGALRVTSNVEVVAESRIFSESGQVKDSVGQFFAGVPASFAIGRGESTKLLGAYGTSPSNTSDFRYNFGFVETNGTSCEVTATLQDEKGTPLATKIYQLAMWEQRQESLTTAFPGVSTENAQLTVKVTSGNGKIIAFASMIANGSQDPATFEMSYDSELLAAASELAVNHDGTLSGDGTVSSPLGLADGAVTQAKMSVTGTASYGKVLGTSGSALRWMTIQSSGGLTLPYSATGSGSKLFSITNTYSGSSSFAIAGLGDAGAGVGGASSDFFGVFGASEGSFSSGGVGVGGVCDSGYGVVGTTDSGVGVAGYSNYSWGLAGYFSGNVQVTGSLTNAANSTVVDDPIDPASKYLYHSVVQSSEMMNIYNGNVTTDESGEAEVELPNWFTALNKDFRYQLSVIGSGDVWAQARISSEINDNHFTIQTSVPKTKVSWLVTGIRNDAYAKAHRIEVEVDKPAQQQGHFLHPELFGEPENKRIGFTSESEIAKHMQEARKAMGAESRKTSK